MDGRRERVTQEGVGLQSAPRAVGAASLGGSVVVDNLHVSFHVLSYGCRVHRLQG